MSGSGEETLLKQAQSGDQSAFTALHAQLEPVIRRFIHRLVGRVAVEDDIVQDAFLALHVNLKRIQPSSNLRPFVFRVVRNLCFDELRRRGRYDSVSLDDPLVGWEAFAERLRQQGPDLDETVAWSLFVEHVKEAMVRLPEPQREALILYCCEDLTYEQVAEATATEVGTVKSRIYYGRQNLRRFVHPQVLEALGIKQKGWDVDGRGRGDKAVDPAPDQTGARTEGEGRQGCHPRVQRER